MADVNKFKYGVIKSGEEGAEVAQAVLKMMNHADEFKMEDGNLFFEKIVEEFGDVLAATDFAYNYAPKHFKDRVNARMNEKLKKFEDRFNGVI